MFRCTTAALLAVLASVSFAGAADKADKVKHPTGTWTHTVQERHGHVRVRGRHAAV